MPVGDLNDPPGWDSERNPPLLDKIAISLFATAGMVLAAIRAGGVAVQQAFEHRALHHSPNTALSPAECATAIVKNVGDPVELFDEATLSGISGQRLHLMTEIIGNPPGPETLLDMWRRKIIPEEKFVQGLKTGMLRNEWIGDYQARFYDPLSAHQYLQGAVEGHVPLEEAVAKAGELGMAPDDARLVYETLGNPPGVVEMLHLWKRGFITEAEVDQAIRESHYKNKYIPAIKEYATYWPPPRTTTTLLAHGAITEAEANRLFQGAGLTPDMARAYTASALHVKTASHKELTVSQVSTLYSEHLITRQMAANDLARVGYAGPEADLLLDLADAKARQKIRQEAINGIRHVFLARRLDESGARAALSRFDVEVAQQDGLIELWEVQRLTPSHSLSIGQLNQALKKGVITHAEFVGRAVDLGYTPADAEIIAKIDEA